MVLIDRSCEDLMLPYTRDSISEALANLVVFLPGYHPTNPETYVAPA